MEASRASPEIDVVGRADEPSCSYHGTSDRTEGLQAASGDRKNGAKNITAANINRSARNFETVNLRVRSMGVVEVKKEPESDEDMEVNSYSLSGLLDECDFQASSTSRKQQRVRVLKSPTTLAKSLSSANKKNAGPTAVAKPRKRLENVIKSLKKSAKTKQTSTKKAGRPKKVRGSSVVSISRPSELVSTAPLPVVPPRPRNIIDTLSTRNIIDTPRRGPKDPIIPQIVDVRSLAGVVNTPVNNPNVPKKNLPPPKPSVPPSANKSGPPIANVSCSNIYPSISGANVKILNTEAKGSAPTAPLNIRFVLPSNISFNKAHFQQVLQAVLASVGNTSAQIDPLQLQKAIQASLAAVTKPSVQVNFNAGQPMQAAATASTSQVTSQPAVGNPSAPIDPLQLQKAIQDSLAAVTKPSVQANLNAGQPVQVATTAATNSQLAPGTASQRPAIQLPQAHFTVTVPQTVATAAGSPAVQLPAVQLPRTQLKVTVPQTVATAAGTGNVPLNKPSSGFPEIVAGSEMSLTSPSFMTSTVSSARQAFTRALEKLDSQLNSQIPVSSSPNVVVTTPSGARGPQASPVVNGGSQLQSPTLIQATTPTSSPIIPAGSPSSEGLQSSQVLNGGGPLNSQSVSSPPSTSLPVTSRKNAASTMATINSARDTLSRIRERLAVSSVPVNSNLSSKTSAPVTPVSVPIVSTSPALIRTSGVGVANSSTINKQIILNLTYLTKNKGPTAQGTQTMVKLNTPQLNPQRLLPALPNTAVASPSSVTIPTSGGSSLCSTGCSSSDCPTSDSSSVGFTGDSSSDCLTGESTSVCTQVSTSVTASPASLPLANASTRPPTFTTSSTNNQVLLLSQGNHLPLMTKISGMVPAKVATASNGSMNVPVNQMPAMNQAHVPPVSPSTYGKLVFVPAVKTSQASKPRKTPGNNKTEHKCAACVCQFCQDSYGIEDDQDVQPGPDGKHMCIFPACRKTYASKSGIRKHYYFHPTHKVKVPQEKSSDSCTAFLPPQLSDLYRKARLRELFKRLTDEEIRELIVPRMAKSVTMYELLERKSSRLGRCRTISAYKMFNEFERFRKEVEAKLTELIESDEKDRAAPTGKDTGKQSAEKTNSELSQPSSDTVEKDRAASTGKDSKDTGEQSTKKVGDELSETSSDTVELISSPGGSASDGAFASKEVNEPKSVESQPDTTTNAETVSSDATAKTVSTVSTISSSSPVPGAKPTEPLSSELVLNSDSSVIDAGNYLGEQTQSASLSSDKGTEAENGSALDATACSSESVASRPNAEQKDPEISPMELDNDAVVESQEKDSPQAEPLNTLAGECAVVHPESRQENEDDMVIGVTKETGSTSKTLTPSLPPPAVTESGSAEANKECLTNQLAGDIGVTEKTETIPCQATSLLEEKATLKPEEIDLQKQESVNVVGGVEGVTSVASRAGQLEGVASETGVICNDSAATGNPATENAKVTFPNHNQREEAQKVSSENDKEMTGPEGHRAPNAENTTDVEAKEQRDNCEEDKTRKNAEEQKEIKHLSTFEDNPLAVMQDEVEMTASVSHMAAEEQKETPISSCQEGKTPMNSVEWIEGLSPSKDKMEPEVGKEVGKEDRVAPTPVGVDETRMDVEEQGEGQEHVSTEHETKRDADDVREAVKLPSSEDKTEMNAEELKKSLETGSEKDETGVRTEEQGESQNPGVDEGSKEEGVTEKPGSKELEGSANVCSEEQNGDQDLATDGHGTRMDEKQGKSQNSGEDEGSKEEGMIEKPASKELEGGTNVCGEEQREYQEHTMDGEEMKMDVEDKNEAKEEENTVINAAEQKDSNKDETNVCGKEQREDQEPVTNGDETKMEVEDKKAAKEDVGEEEKTEIEATEQKDSNKDAKKTDSKEQEKATQPDIEEEGISVGQREEPKPDNGDDKMQKDAGAEPSGLASSEGQVTGLDAVDNPSGGPQSSSLQDPSKDCVASTSDIVMVEDEELSEEEDENDIMGFSIPFMLKRGKVVRKIKAMKVKKKQEKKASEAEMRQYIFHQPRGAALAVLDSNTHICKSFFRDYVMPIFLEKNIAKFGSFGWDLFSKLSLTRKRYENVFRLGLGPELAQVLGINIFPTYKRIVDTVRAQKPESQEEMAESWGEDKTSDGLENNDESRVSEVVADVEDKSEEPKDSGKKRKTTQPPTEHSKKQRLDKEGNTGQSTVEPSGTATAGAEQKQTESSLSSKQTQESSNKNSNGNLPGPSKGTLGPQDIPTKATIFTTGALSSASPSLPLPSAKGAPLFLVPVEKIPPDLVSKFIKTGEENSKKKVQPSSVVLVLVPSSDPAGTPSIQTLTSASQLENSGGKKPLLLIPSDKVPSTMIGQSQTVRRKMIITMVASSGSKTSTTTTSTPSTSTSLLDSQTECTSVTPSLQSPITRSSMKKATAEAASSLPAKNISEKSVTTSTESQLATVSSASTISTSSDTVPPPSVVDPMVSLSDNVKSLSSIVHNTSAVNASLGSKREQPGSSDSASLSPGSAPVSGQIASSGLTPTPVAATSVADNPSSKETTCDEHKDPDKTEMISSTNVNHNSSGTSGIDELDEMLESSLLPSDSTLDTILDEFGSDENSDLQPLDLMDVISNIGGETADDGKNTRGPETSNSAAISVGSEASLSSDVDEAATTKKDLPQNTEQTTDSDISGQSSSRHGDGSSDISGDHTYAELQARRHSPRKSVSSSMTRLGSPAASVSGSEDSDGGATLRRTSSVASGSTNEGEQSDEGGPPRKRRRGPTRTSARSGVRVTFVADKMVPDRVLRSSPSKVKEAKQ